MDQQFDNAGAIVDEFALELVDLTKGALPGRLVAKALDAFDQQIKDLKG